MIPCPSCSAPADEGSRFCPACGKVLLVSAPTAVSPAHPAALADDQRSRVNPERSPSTEGRFIPGTLLAGRYRLVALLGRGGMGEVYRADDTRLGQTVALKFLPDAVARDAAALERFYAEVRIGRQVSHPNVVRLYDLIEVEGHHCLAMEYVDGEDLSSLLSRIGRLPADKAVDIARDLCAGLAAAHDKGVIHRDLKPANIMIDGKGRARIADFGIAALADDIDGQDFAGTAAYTAPELLTGQPASVRSDLYALGLVLYETFTGKRLFEARSLAELKAMQERSGPPSLSSNARDIPVAMERVVLRCLEKDPDARPASAHAVMAALPGGDPLQAAMDAGETPSPGMVAAAGKVGELQSGVAWVCLLAALAGLLLVAWLAGRSTLIGRLSPEKSPEVLTEKARELLGTLGYGAGLRDSNGAFYFDSDYLAYIAAHDPSPRRWERIRTASPGPLTFLLRQSPSELVAERTLLRTFGPSEAGRVLRDDPPATTPGMVDVELDPWGRLVGLRAVPLQSEPAAVSREPDWELLLTAAGMAPGTLTSTAPRAAVPVDSDRKAAWSGSYPGQPGTVLRVEAAAYRGKPVWFQVQGPWRRTQSPSKSTELPPVFRIAIWISLIFGAGATVAIGVLVRRNLRLGRGDRLGALRVAGFLFGCSLIAQMLRADHVALAYAEISLVTNLLAQALFYAVVAWFYYMALEPVARRRWPQLLVGWARLLAGGSRDPLVGRDLLVGTLAGVALAVVVHLAVVVPAWFGLPTPPPRGQVLSSLGDIRHLAYFIFWNPSPAVSLGVGTLFALFLFRAIVRSHWLAFGMLSVVLYFVFAAIIGSKDLLSLSVALFTAIYLLVMLRAGLLAGVASLYCFLLLEATPLTLEFSAWYADRTLATLVLLGGLLVYGFRVSLGGKPLFGSYVLERDG